jgi:hypothetical protein
MTFKPKLWLSVGAVAFAGATFGKTYADDDSTNWKARVHPFAKELLLAQSGESGEGGERGRRPQAGEAGEAGERGEARRSKPSRVRKPVSGQYDKRKSEREKNPQQPLQAFGDHGGERGERIPALRRMPGGGEGGERGEGGEAGVNTRYIFGFTEGADTERRGEREFENDAIGRFGKRAGTYAAIGNETELEFGITDNLMAELGGLTAFHHIRNVPQLDDRTSFQFDGFATTLKYQLFSRATNGFGLAFSAEPEWHRVSETSGNRENRYDVEFKSYADGEIIPRKMYWAVNLTYEPEVARSIEPGVGAVTERKSGFSASGAVAGALMPSVFLGAEMRYLSTYEGLGLNHFEGSGLYLGPTLSAKLSSKVLVQVAYSHRLFGKNTIDDPDAIFEKQQVCVRFVAEF